MKYCKIKEGTAAWEKMDKIFNFKKQWGIHETEISEFLGFPMDNNIAFEVNNLWARPKVIREYRPDWVKEFKKSEDSITSTRANSKIKKAWVNLCEKLGFETHTPREFTFQFGLAFMGSTEYHEMDSEYFVLIDNDKFDFSKHDWAEPVEESAFLRERADWLDKEAE